jgi:hypothetical protein
MHRAVLAAMSSVLGCWRLGEKSLAARERMGGKGKKWLAGVGWVT